MPRWKIVAAVATLVIAALHLASVPSSIWEYDENFFALAVEHYQPLLHHPPPPGSPLYIAFAKVLATFLSPFAALVATSTLATLLGLIAWMAAFRAITDERTAIMAAVVLYASPSILVSGTLALADAGALALLALAVLAGVRRNPFAMAVFCAATIGWRPQFSIMVVPMFLAATVLLKTWRDRIAAVVAFGVACLAWLIPVVVATGGPEPYWKWLSSQAAYYAAHDADLSRSGHSTTHIALRFLAHPWGPKWLSIPLLALAAGGAAVVALRKNVKIVPLATGGVVYLAFALATMDPADAVRYAIPALPLIAVLAASSTRTPQLATVTAIAYGIGAYWYASPVLRTRATTNSPPAAAARWIRANVPRNAIVLYDLPLRPHADYLLRGWNTKRFDVAVEPDAPMVIYADGERGGARGVTFRWPDTDAYRKLTRQHYGAVSVIQLPVTERFRVREGIFPPERTRDGKSWRWISDRGVLELPDVGAREVRITLRAPPEYPLDENRVRIDLHGRSAWISVQRNATSSIDLPIPRGPVRIVFTPERSFVPAKIAGANNRDTRTLSVMLVRIEQRGHEGNGDDGDDDGQQRQNAPDSRFH